MEPELLIVEDGFRADDEAYTESLNVVRGPWESVGEMFSPGEGPAETFGPGEGPGEVANDG